MQATQYVRSHVGQAYTHPLAQNVSVVDTKSQTAIGAPIATWAVYADPARPSPNESTCGQAFGAAVQAKALVFAAAFSVTVPDLGGACANAGACTLQWYWFGKGVAQTYESCVDFVQ